MLLISRAKTLAVIAIAALALSIPVSASAAGGGTISGTVIGSDTSAGIEFIGVTAYDSHGVRTYVGTTGPTGDYEIIDVPAGDYTVEFREFLPDATYGSEWAGDTPFESSSTIISITGTETVDLDATLTPGGRITGALLVAANPYPPVSAFAWDPVASDWVSMGKQGGSDGETYQIGALPGGLSYRVWVQQIDTTLTVSQFYPNARSLEAAQDISVAAGETVSGIDFSLGSTYAIPSARISGSDRFVTSAKIAQNYNSSGTDHVFLASGLNYPDALSAGPVAAAFDAPLLLTLPGEVPPSVVTEIERIDPATIVVVGSAATISEDVVAQLEELIPGVTVERVAGPDRFATSRALARYAFGEHGAETAWVATGLNFPDALSAAAVGGSSGSPVILVNGGASSVDSATAQLLADLGVLRVSIAGGPTTVSNGIAASLNQLPGLQYADRVAGADRYQTSADINRLLLLTPADKVYLAVGTGFADALAGAALAARDGAPLFIVPNNCVPTATRQHIYSMSTQTVVLLGGTPSLGVPVQSLTAC